MACIWYANSTLFLRAVAVLSETNCYKPTNPPLLSIFLNAHAATVTEWYQLLLSAFVTCSSVLQNHIREINFWQPVCPLHMKHAILFPQNLFFSWSTLVTSFTYRGCCRSSSHCRLSPGTKWNPSLFRSSFVFHLMTCLQSAELLAYSLKALVAENEPVKNLLAAVQYICLLCLQLPAECQRIQSHCPEPFLTHSYCPPQWYSAPLLQE